eukprot:TRINITY_DN8762_c0_g1_i1.p1 TRINITY_DN8762_c0_g1~~TRINITY_DN8762_c0_g1_i1.p1  ORF type:complete len:908 (-),score=133.55 TRINITY_DN8762_c0_g1_i1:28-2583(-)
MNELSILSTYKSFHGPNPAYNGPLQSARSPAFLYQHLPITQQLDLGARYLEFELHWLSKYSDLYACVGSSDTYEHCYGSLQTPQQNKWCILSGTEDLGPNTGCNVNYDINWDHHLQDIRGWLNDNPNQFVWISVDWRINSKTNTQNEITQAQDVMLQRLQNHFSAQEIFIPSDKTSNWPSLSDLQTSGKKIGVICGDSSCPSSPSLWEKLESASYPEQYHRISSLYGCDIMWANSSFTPDPADFFYLYDDEGLGIQFDKSSTLRTLSCGYSPKFDIFSRQKSSMTIWSWAPNEPSLAYIPNPTSPDAACVYLNATSGNWFTALCGDLLLPKACYDTSSSLWTVTAPTFGHLSTANCPSGQLDFPHNAAQNSALLTSIPQSYSSVWITNMPAVSAALPLAPPPASYRDYLPPRVDYHDPYLNYSSSVEPRFCALSSSATSFTCDWKTYESLVAQRIPGYIVLGIFIAILFVGVVGLSVYCWINENKKYDKITRGTGEFDESEEDLGRGGGRYRDLLLYQAVYVVPLIFLIVGMALIWTANIEFNATSAGSRQELADRYALLENTEESIKDIIYLLTGVTDLTSFATISASMKAGLLELSTSIHFFVTGIDTLSTARNVIVILTSITPLILSIVGCVLLRAERLKGLIITIILLDIMIVLCGCAFIVHADIRVVSQDVCKEFSYSDSMFKLWETSIIEATSQLSPISEGGVIAITERTCSSWENLCVTQPHQVCANWVCNQNTISSLENSTFIIDTDGETHPVVECISRCLSSSLRAASERYHTNQHLWIQVNRSVETLRFLEGHIGDFANLERMNTIFCQDYKNSLKHLDDAFAVLLVGIIIMIAYFFRFGW